MEETHDDLSTKWPDGDYNLTWSSHWKKLWEGGVPPRVMLWTWKLLRRAFFMGERAATMKVAFDPCCRCKEATKTVPHLFYGCRDSLSRWNLLRSLSLSGRINIHVPHGLLELIDEAIKIQRKGGLLIFILYSVTSSIWKDRNQTLFNQKPQKMPLKVALEQARAEIEGSFKYKHSPTRWERGINALEEINKLLRCFISALHPASDINADEERNSREDCASLFSNLNSLEDRQNSHLTGNLGFESRDDCTPPLSHMISFDNPQGDHFTRDFDIKNSDYRLNPNFLIDRAFTEGIPLSTN
ncbi:hypothetical protein R1flu_014038 [Riccia fluitans]|uniref:Reverse transcriptase zinc-binding domain-containing protein n=1 Tax=Riccia fluitans TaxID=41844 RepID=A0ABD1YI36_9MARC